MKNPLSKTSWRGRRHHSSDTTSLAYLIYLSKKFDIDPYKLLNCFIGMEKKNEAECCPLKILLRKRDKDHATFLISKERKIVAQLRLRTELWKSSDKTKDLYSKLVNGDQSSIKPVKSPSSIKELRRGMRNVDLRVKVSRKSEVHHVISRRTGKPFRLCAATVTDPSGSIRLPLWNGQIDSVHVGDEIEIKKGYITVFRGVLQIVPSKKNGELKILKPSKPPIVR